MTEQDYKALSRGISRDMSPDAIARRLQIASDLHDLVKDLAQAKNLGKVEVGGHKDAGQQDQSGPGADPCQPAQTSASKQPPTSRSRWTGGGIF
jgi:hypothetical protein